MQARTLGKTGLKVSILGFGAGQVGDGALAEREAEALLHAVLDSGITLIDTARAYGLSEERIGRYLSHRRDEFVLSTKGGYGAEGAEDWTAPAITAGIDQALRRLRTDHLDVFHLHSCPREVLEREDLLQALATARAQGKIRAAGYSGEGEALGWAISSGRFEVIQTSVNLFDQRGLDTLLPEAADAGLGVLAKRALGNTPWRFHERPAGHYAETYWERMRAMQLDFDGPGGPGGPGWLGRALRFSAFAPGVSSILVGTRDPRHLAENLAHLDAGPLPEAEVAQVRALFREKDQGWLGQV